MKTGTREDCGSTRRGTSGAADPGGRGCCGKDGNRDQELLSSSSGNTSSGLGCDILGYLGGPLLGDTDGQVVTSL